MVCCGFVLWWLWVCWWCCVGGGYAAFFFILFVISDFVWSGLRKKIGDLVFFIYFLFFIIAVD